MERMGSKRLRILFLFGDLLFLLIGLSIGFWFFLPGLPSVQVLQISGAISSIWLILIFLRQPYKFSRLTHPWVFFKRQFEFGVLLLLFLFPIFYLQKAIQADLLTLMACNGMSVLGIFTWRFIFYNVTRFYLNQHHNYRNVVIVGSGEAALSLSRFFESHAEYGFRFLRFFSGSRTKMTATESFQELNTFCKEHTVHEIYCVTPSLTSTHLRQIVDYGISSLISVKLVSDFSSITGRGFLLEQYDRIPILRVAAVPLDETFNSAVKRTFDLIVASLVFVLVLSWMVPLVALLIKLDSRGPVFFRQLRAGRGNRPFDCLKFRTMQHDNGEFRQATKEDPRVTRIGRLLRKLSLDEFPQFLNVLSGEMSIIGPRPHPIELNEQYEHRVANYGSRHYIKPGITGLAQVRGFRGEILNLLSMKGRITLDKFYIEKWSLLLDLKILVATIPIIFRGDYKAY